MQLADSNPLVAGWRLKAIPTQPQRSGLASHAATKEVQVQPGERLTKTASLFDPREWGAEPDCVHWDSGYFEPEGN